MAKHSYLLFAFLLVPLLSGCNSQGRIIINDYEVYVEEKMPIDVIFTAQEEDVNFIYESENMVIEDGVIRGLMSGTSTSVKAKTKSGLETNFTVTVSEDNYVSTNSNELSEGWLDPITVEPIPELSGEDEFPLGIDISMVEQVYAMGGQYYNQDGKAESVYHILKDHGVNYVRIRLWNDPFNHVGEELVPYGGGICDIATVLPMARHAKEAGMKILLDYHFSDFWADPGKQVMPKDWASYSSAEDVASAMAEYVRTTLQALQSVNAMPDMVQLGNEITNGLFTSAPGGTNTTLTGDNPYYISQRSGISSLISAPNGSANLHAYMHAALNAVHDLDPDILTMIHIAKGMTGIDYIKNYYHQFDDLDYDIIGLSGYSYYHFQTGLATLQNCLNAISEEFPTKKITIAETAYGYTYAPHAWASNIFSRTGGQALSGYDVSVQGQATLTRDIIEAVASLDNGYGVFYWEGAWLPIQGAGWADANSKCSWANQTFFTYDGRVLPSLELFSRIKE